MSLYNVTDILHHVTFLYPVTISNLSEKLCLLSQLKSKHLWFPMEKWHVSLRTIPKNQLIMIQFTVPTTLSLKLKSSI